MSKKSKNIWINLGLIAAVIVIFVISFSVAPKEGSEEGEAFGGTDSVVTEQIEESGYEPWFSPIFEPGSGEIESGLFALQAALGAGIAGFALGNLRGRKKAAEELTPASATKGAATNGGARGLLTPGADTASSEE
ncbi:energy-coupling factor ABC transporter substrate-binding protein [Propionimicrobium lymphophilum]|uniref:Cobalt transport protein CbiN n=1 Tax=Propionimicrobium lymphophilum ACS-093-V-SCH5 TaxID=883161 RepID=S2W2E0_9ACTN|nr:MULTISPECIES: energy-coupling factor ABC transporter substrate-binding protein [Propionimicrobium]EPD32520.1 cobalt transporter [Propionimicrobium lymphophilum ACS-093-V-SCH5]ETJ97040.1 cobalt transport protein component CbiN [Propionimicrobium sp. BV2F7]MDK7710499.1 energy-coupling factor ABC transporter substrate-binding protein [Propionimicrobium lymphophilum]MDK7734479.1 energy-coupling factor ABC transporter substrate-binding protein [Propionimicrobium lymphophilum]